MNDFMHKIMDLIEQGRTIVAKKGDKADPEDLAMAVLNYCEGAGYTIEELFRLEMALDRVFRENTRKCQEETKINVPAELLS